MMLEQVFPCSLWRVHIGAVFPTGTAACARAQALAQAQANFFFPEGNLYKSRENCEEERVTEKNYYVLIITPHSSSAIQGRKEIWNEGEKRGMGKSKGKVF